MATVELPVTMEWTPEILEGLPSQYWRVETADDDEAIVHQHHLVHEQNPIYAEARVVMLSTLEKEGL
jgi:hypothetical protein